MLPALSLSGVVFIMLIYVKMPTIVGILKFISRINFVLSWVVHGKSFIISGPTWKYGGSVFGTEVAGGSQALALGRAVAQW